MRDFLQYMLTLFALIVIGSLVAAALLAPLWLA